MTKAAGFLMGNIRTIGLIYVVGAIAVFFAVSMILRYRGEAEDEEQELANDDTKSRKTVQNTVAFIIGLLCASMWMLILVTIFGLWMRYIITERLPEMKKKWRNKG